MKTQRFAIGLTALNLVILMSVMLRANAAPTPQGPRSTERPYSSRPIDFFKGWHV